MTPKIKVSFSEVGCRKPNCTHRFDIPNRHHMGSEKQWVNLWLRPGSIPVFRGSEALGRKMHELLREHYYAFRKRDVVILCEWHHVEIHQIYKETITRLAMKIRKPSKFFTFEEALLAIRLCRKACREWLKVETPGMNPKKAQRRGYWR